MSSSHPPPSVLVVCNADEAAAFTEPLHQPMSTGTVQVLQTSQIEEAEELFLVHHPEVLVVAASLQHGDAAALIERVRSMVGRAEVAVVVVGDVDGPVLTALDAAELGGDRFVARPLAAKALRYAVAVSLDAARLARGGRISNGAPHPIHDDPTDSYRQAQRDRWARLADSIIDARADEPLESEATTEAVPLPPPLLIQPRRHASAPIATITDEATGGIGAELALLSGPAWPDGERTPVVARPYGEHGRERSPAEASAERGSGQAVAEVPETREARETREAPETRETREARDAREAREAEAADADFAGLDDELADFRDDDDLVEDALPARVVSASSLAAFVGIGGRSRMEPMSRPGPAGPIPPPASSTPRALASGPGPASVVELRSPAPTVSDRSSQAAASGSEDAVWSAPELLAQLHEATLDAAPVVPSPTPLSPPGGREFARQLRQKMSAMAQRLFAHQGEGATALDAAPQHDHQIEFDLAALVEEPALSDGPEIVGLRTSVTPVFRETQPGTWDGGARDVKERNLPETGELIRGTCDAPAILVRMWALSATGRVVFRRGEIEKFVFFDQGRPVFASSTELHDRMGELLYREGKITHAQYMHSRSLVAESGRRMGEILVDLGYLKRRELYPAVRRHVEDIIYSLFAWDHGSYRISVETAASTERIRLARHPEAIVLEGIRRKLDRSVLERLVGPPSTVLQLNDRERLAGLVGAIELGGEERAALAAIDGQSDLPAIARAAGLPVPAVLPLAWALIVLGYATARRDSANLAEETSQVGEIDLAIDRERVRARWQLVAEADYFTLLGVRRDATSFEIRRAYEASRRDFAAEGFPGELRRELARELDDIATVLDEAFRVLRDDPLRREYLAHLVD